MVKQDDDRARRLAAALRENLKRRKAQAREQLSESSRPFDAACGGAQDKLRPGPMNTEGED